MSSFWLAVFLFSGNFVAELAPAAQILGFEPGERPATLEEIEKFVKTLSDTCPAARLVNYGRSYEGRRLYALLISDPENLEKIDNLKENLRRLADPRLVPAGEAVRLAAETPALAWLAFSIHGDELSGSDAALLLAWKLCRAQSQTEQLILRQVVTVLDISENPDGRFRTLAQLQTLQGRVSNPDPDTMQHVGLWPWGRWNHYWFDPNRDYLALVHPETRARVAAWLEYTPQLVVDIHEMWGDSTFLMSPPRDPHNPHVPAHVAHWLERFAADNARRFDENGFAYYTGAWNEEFYLAYGSAWPKYFGAIGILHEQAGSDGGPLKRRTGGILSYRRTVEQQLQAALANLETLARNREEILQDFHQGRREALAAGARSRQPAYLVAPGENPERAARLIATLLRHGIEVYRSAGPVEVEGLHSPWSETGTKKRFEPFVYLVRAEQPLYPLVKNLMDFHVPQAPDSLRRERLWLEKKRQSRLYETTAWSLPLLFGVEAYWAEQAPRGNWQKVERGNFPQPPECREARFGYLFDGRSDSAPALVASLMADEATVRVASEPFVHGGRQWPRGTFLVRKEENTIPDQRILELGRRWKIALVPLSGARAEKGADFGSDEFRPLRPVRAAALCGFPVSPPAFGEIWHLFDYRLRQRLSALEMAGLRRVDLDRYNLIILPPVFGGPQALGALLGKEQLEALTAWVRDGGTLIALGNAAEFLADKEKNLLVTRPRGQVLERFPPPALGLGPKQAADAGWLRAVGVVIPPAEKNEATSRSEPWPHYDDPYAVPPLVGPGARPFLDPSAAIFQPPQKIPSLVDWVRVLQPAGKEEELKAILSEADSRLRRFQQVGVILSVELDTEHWLSWSSPERIAVHFEGDEALLAEPPAQVAARFSDVERLHLSGLLWPEGAGRLARTAYLVREALGRGQVILFAGHPLYRASAWASQRLFLNAALFGPSLGASWSAPW